MDIERRMLAVEELRAEPGEDGKPTKIVGRAAVFNKLSDPIGGAWGGGFREKIAPGAFSESIASDDVLALFNHNPDIVLGSSHAGTLRLKESRGGLDIEIDPPDTTAARDLMTSIERRDVKRMSFGFITQKDAWEFKDGKQPDERTLVKVKVMDISPVAFAQYPQTKVDVRAAFESRDARQSELAVERGAEAKLACEIRRRQLELADRRTEWVEMFGHV